MLGTQLVDGGSDSQDVNRLLETFIHRYGFTLIEALELIFPPILSEVERLPTDLNLTGYDGGTGAARAHSLQHVGLPVDIGIVEAHHALLASGMRKRVELWADGAVRSPDDVVKLMCMGANRVGFGTVAMLALGCLLCRQCKTGMCPMGITTQVKTADEAAEQGFKRFTPLDYAQSVEGLVRLFGAFGDEVRAIAARLGVARLQDLVGRAELLEQTSHFLRFNLADLLTPATSAPGDRPAGLVPLRRPRNHLTPPWSPTW